MNRFHIQQGTVRRHLRQAEHTAYTEKAEKIKD